MKFRTKIEITPLQNAIGYDSRIFTIGSCFAQNIAARLRQAKFMVTESPTGILFNPLSIANALNRYTEATPPRCEDLVFNNGLWHSFEAHSSLSSASQSTTLDNLAKAIASGNEALRSADCVVITFGTAWVYTLPNGETVANCHKFASSNFTRRRLTVEEITETFVKLCSETLGDKNIILTVSPIRHLSDGLSENSLSKSILRVAADEICRRCDNATYFPSFEILNDDLRDYRFYAEDLAHPSQQAVDYIWEKFVAAALNNSAKALLSHIEKIVAAASHRPFNPDSEEYAQFCRRNIEAIEKLPNIDFSEERKLFKRYSDKF